MLIHIRPRLFSPFRNVALIDLEIKPLGLKLTGGIDLVARRPYRNGHYAVACRKQGHKAIDGFLIETATLVDELHTTARWAIEAETVVTHEVHYTLLDHDFDAASDSMRFWYGCCAEFGAWASRMPARRVPEPMMEVLPPNQERPDTEDIFDGKHEWITSRRQTFAMPTIERERLLDTKLYERNPPLNAAFHPPCPK